MLLMCVHFFMCYFFPGLTSSLLANVFRQGTVTPVHFNVIYDSTGLKPDHFQRLSYKLTHLYYNWPVKMNYLIF